MKKCSKCFIEQPNEAFYKGKWCNTCLKAYKKQWIANNSSKVKTTLKAYYDKNRDDILIKTKKRRQEFPELKKQSELKFKFKMTMAEYELLLLKQENKCAICKNSEKSVEIRTGKIRSLAVDHCHKTNKVRALLCSNCNRAMGLLLENAETMQEMIAYVKRFKNEI
jgi:hypothetical protein